ncbi:MULTISPECIES: ABC transporter ATP-binding protein [Tistrella]|uniref:ABC transporter ATP-binding protein n=1 Tax=Tistrella TaxID=171436 RepID=UPI0031FB2691
MTDMTATAPMAALAATPATKLLDIRDLTITLPSGGDRARAVDDISLSVGRNEIVCLVGESGSGKSMTAHAVLGLLPPRVRLTSGQILLDGRDVAPLTDDAMRRIRGRDVAMIFQEPLSALNPLAKAGDQVAEAMAIHGRFTATERRARVRALFEGVGLPDPATIVRRFPFQLSGGQRQRVMIAMALANDPALLVADEPTTALDVTTQRQILDLIRAQQQARGMGVLFITHDFGVVADIADRVVVMRHGQVVETGPGGAVLARPSHAYTRTLIDAVPGRAGPRATDAAHAGDPAAGDTLLRIRGLRKTFTSRTGFASRRTVAAADDISLDLRAGESLAVVGESGSGKSTLARMVMALTRPDAGEILFDGRNIAGLGGAALKSYRHRVQMVFQDPFASLNPRHKVGEAIARGPIAFGTSRDEAMAIARRLLERVGLDASAAGRYPHEFSGGQRQRICIARALAPDPAILVADEAVSALDVSVQAQILALLAELRRELNLAMIFITHDLRVAAEVSDRTVVMRHGRIVEQGPTAALFANPTHDYTRALLAAIPGRSVFAAHSTTAPVSGQTIP